MHLAAVDLARMQFAFTVGFHIIFPAFSIGLASYLAVLDGLWNFTCRSVYLDLFNYWKKIFAINFGMGVVSGLVLSYQFGTNWSVFSDKTGPVIGPLMGYEVLTAFFLEAGFLGVMLFGEGRVSPKLRLFASCMVALGTAVSAFWITAANSWMQTPQGFAMDHGKIVPVDWLKVVFSPSFPYRLVHMAIAAFIVAALIVAACSAWHLLRGRRDAAIKTSFSMGMWMLVCVVPVQMVVGDAHGLNTREYQPAKIAAIEGLWVTEKEGTSLNLIGWPDMQDEVTKYAIKVPHLGSVILTHTWNGEIKGLKDFLPEDRPNSTIVFWSFRLMVGLGLLMFLLGLMGLALRRGGKLFESRLLQLFALLMGPAGLVALIAGWVTTEVGRQPWVVYGVMRTVNA